MSDAMTRSADCSLFEAHGRWIAPLAIFLLGAVAGCGEFGQDANSSRLAQASTVDAITHLRFDTPVSWGEDESDNKWLYDTETDTDYRIRMQGDADWGTLNTWISPKNGYDSNRSLGVAAYDHDGCDYKQRVEFEFSHKTYFRQDLEDDRYYGIALYIHPSSQDIIKKTTFLQGWQVHDSSEYGRKPPMSLSFIEGPDYRWQVEVSTAGGDIEDAPGVQTSIFVSEDGLDKGVWHRFVVRFKPSVSQGGAIRVWLDDELPLCQGSCRLS